MLRFLLDTQSLRNVNPDQIADGQRQKRAEIARLNT